MKTIRKIGFAFIAVLMCFTFAACSDDDDPISDNISDTKWELVSTDNGDFEDLSSKNGLTIEFKKNGECIFTPAFKYTKSKWSVKDGKLKILLITHYTEDMLEEEPDRVDHEDFLEGSFTINGTTATYTFLWYDEGYSDNTYTMVLEKI